MSSTYRYEAYGKTLSTSGSDYNPFRYGGKFGYYSDQNLPLMLAGARWYSPHLLRWLSFDPISYDGGDNLYAYVMGNPVGYVDPSGLDQIRNHSGGPVTISGNPGGDSGSGDQFYGIIPPDGKVYGGPKNPVSANRWPYTPFSNLGPYFFPLPPNKVEDIDYFCDGFKMEKTQGDADGPITTLGRDSDGRVGVTDRIGVPASFVRYGLRKMKEKLGL